jgi:hypothetical protein
VAETAIQVAFSADNAGVDVASSTPGNSTLLFIDGWKLVCPESTSGL